MYHQSIECDFFRLNGTKPGKIFAATKATDQITTENFWQIVMTMLIGVFVLCWLIFTAFMSQIINNNLTKQ